MFGAMVGWFQGIGEPESWTQLGAVLVWIVTGGGAGVLAYLAWNELESWFPALDALQSKLKRYITTALTVLFGAAGYGIQILMKYQTPPDSWRMGIEEAFSVIALALIAALTVHGARNLD